MSATEQAAIQKFQGNTPNLWDDARIALARKAVTPPTATEDEFLFFIEWNRRTGLDPFIKQSYLVERRSKVPGSKDQWTTKHEPLAAEAGMAALADAQADYGGIKGAIVYAGDVFDVDENEQVITHKWNLADRAKNANKVVGAWAHAKRKGRTVQIVYLPIESRMQTKKDYNSGKEVPTQFWSKDPGGMILKCARALSYRLAYPNIFSGVFIREEIRDEEEVETLEAQTPPATPPGATRTVALLAKVQQQVAPAPAATQTVEQVPVQTVAETKPVEVVKDDPAEAAHTESLDQREEAEIGPLLAFGKMKGTPISALDAEQLAGCIVFATEKIKTAKPTDNWVVPLRANLAALLTEEQKRLDEMELS